MGGQIKSEWVDALARNQWTDWAGIRNQAQLGITVKDLCRKYGISEQTFYNWRTKYGHMDINDARKLRALEVDYRQLKRLVADLSLDNQILKDLLEKTPHAQSEGRCHEARCLPLWAEQKRACMILNLTRSTSQYEPLPHNNEKKLRARMKEMAHTHKRYDSPHLHLLLKRE